MYGWVGVLRLRCAGSNSLLVCALDYQLVIPGRFNVMKYIWQYEPDLTLEKNTCTEKEQSEIDYTITNIQVGVMSHCLSREIEQSEIDYTITNI